MILMSLTGSIIDGVGVVLVIFKSSNIVSVSSKGIVKLEVDIVVPLHDEVISGVNPRTLCDERFQ